jgi:hypothetical protein
MDQRADYVEPYPPLATRPQSIRRHLYTIGIAALVLLAATLVTLKLATKVRDGLSPVKVSIVRASELTEACQIYRDCNPAKTYPEKLEDLLHPTFYAGPFVSDHILKDGWGDPFRYALVPNADGELEPYVWTERVMDGKVTLYGAKRTADGKSLLIGWPEKK